MAVAMQKVKTFQSYDHLRASGISDQQSRALVELVDECLQTHMESVATKAGLLLTKAELRHEMSEMKSELRHEMSEMKSELRYEMSEMKSELRQDMAELKLELKTDISALKVSMQLMQRLFFGGTLLILLSIAALFLHQ